MVTLFHSKLLFSQTFSYVFYWVSGLFLCSLKKEGQHLIYDKKYLGTLRPRNFRGRQTYLSCGKWCVPAGSERPDFSLSFQSRW